MPRRLPFAIGRDHALRGLPIYSHHHNYRRYDSANANAAYLRGYGIGTRERIDGGSTHIDLFDMAGISAPRSPKRKWSGL